MRFRKKFLWSIFSIFIFYMLSLATGRGTFSSPQAYPHFIPVRTYDVLHEKLNLQFDLQNQAISGTATIQLTPINDSLKTIVLDAVELNIHSINLNNKTPLNYRQTDKKLIIQLDQPYNSTDTLNLRIAYDAHPRKGLYFIHPDKAYPHKPYQVWSQGEMEDNRYWFPCYDEPNERFTSEMIATIPEDMMAISNGKLIEVKENPARHTRTFHWKESIPHVSYLVSIVVGKFAEIRNEWDGIPILYYVEPQEKDKALRSFAKTPDMVKFFSQKIGVRYPYEKYAQTTVRDFMWGGMENISATTLTRSTLHDERAHLDVNSDGLVAHELAHQWWGDLLTMKTWSHVWLNESFATYFDALYAEHDRGREAYLMKMDDNLHRYMKEDSTKYRRPIVTNRYEDATEMFDSHAYPKGAWVLQMIRYILGDKAWWKAIHHYAEKYREKVVETNDFREAIEEATGQPMDWFFDEWLYKAGYPEYQVSYNWDEENRFVNLTVRQAQELTENTPLFRMPIEIVISGKNIERTYKIEVGKREEQFQLNFPENPQMVEFDPGQWVLKTLQFEKSVPELICQLQHSRYPMSRRRAAKWLGEKPETTETIVALANALRNDPFWGVREQAARSLGKFNSLRARDALLTALSDTKSKVRREVVKALKHFKKDQRVEKALLKLFQSDPSYYVQAEVVKSLVAMEAPSAEQICRQAIRMNSHEEVIRKAGLQGLVKLNPSHAYRLATRWTQYGQPEQLRVAAISTFPKLAKASEAQREKIFQRLKELLNDPYFRARVAAIEALGKLGDPRAIPYLKEIEKKELAFRWKKAAREAIAKIQQKSPKKALKELQLEMKKIESRLTRLQQILKAMGNKLNQLNFSKENQGE